MKLIRQKRNARCYQLDFTITKFMWGKSFMTIAELFASDPVNLKPEYELLEDLKSIDKICISDAHTHIERLTFPAFYVKNKATNEIIVTSKCNTICGKPTFMIDGGDHRSVYKDETYVRLLRKWNADN